MSFLKKLLGSKVSHDPEEEKKDENNVENKFSESFEIIVDYNRSLTEMVNSGNYDSIGHQITANNFPIRGEGKQKISIKLLRISEMLETEEVISKIDEQGYRPARIEQLLALGEAYPDLQRNCSVTALGSYRLNISNDRETVQIGNVNSKRFLFVTLYENIWTDKDRFAVVPKPEKDMVNEDNIENRFKALCNDLKQCDENPAVGFEDIERGGLIVDHGLLFAGDVDSLWSAIQSAIDSDGKTNPNFEFDLMWSKSDRDWHKIGRIQGIFHLNSITQTKTTIIKDNGGEFWYKFESD